MTVRRIQLVLLAASLAVWAALPSAQAPAGRQAPLTILVSFDGWRWDYDTKAPAPNLRSLMARGVRAEGLIPGYPSKTVPNHYSMATGLYPGHHGMIANIIRDPASGRTFRRTTAPRSKIRCGGAASRSGIPRSGRG